MPEDPDLSPLLFETAPPLRHATLDATSQRRVWLRRSWNKATIGVAFVEDARFARAGIAALVWQIACEWSSASDGRLGLERRSDPQQADVVVEIAHANDSWSHIGPPPTAPGEPSMKIGANLRRLAHDPSLAQSDDFRHRVLHEFGHMLGFIHEHQTPAATLQWDIDAICSDPAVKARGWGPGDIEAQVIAHLEGLPASSSRYDASSVMHYPFPPGWVKGAHPTPPNARLSEDDIEGVRRVFGRLPR